MIRHAKPIWTETVEVNQYIEARQRFVITAPVPAALQICADTEYAACLNGAFVGSGQYHTFRGVKVYDEYDVTGLVRAGENELTVTAYAAGEDSQTHQMDIPMLVFALQCGNQTIISGEGTEIREHPCYESGRIEKVTSQLGYACHYHAGGAQTPWRQATVLRHEVVYRERPVKQCRFAPLVTGKLVSQGTVVRSGTGTPAELMQHDGLSFRAKEDILEGNLVKHRADGVFFVLDLGEEYTGVLFMELEAGAGTVIDIGWGEHLQDMRVRTSVGGRNFACRYVCKDGLQSFTGYFRRLGARFLQIHITHMTQDVRLHQIGLQPVEYPLDREGSFVCNDFLMNRLCKAAGRTLKLCMHEHYEDCPWREQALYAFDSCLQMLCGYYLFGEYDFARASLKLLAEGQREDGMLLMCAPSGITTAIPSFALSWIVSLEKYVLYSGDVAFGREMLPVAERVLGAFRVRGNLVQNDPRDDNWHFYEWSEGLSGEDFASTDAPINFYYILACEAYQKLCGYTGTEEKQGYHDLDEIRSAVRATFFDARSGFFRTRAGENRCHELTQALAICCGAAENTGILDRLLENHGLIKSTLSTSIFKYEALLSAGKQYQDAVLEEIADIWGKMLFAGADTLWEVAEGASAFWDAGSLCHGWSAVPVYLLYKYYLGYEPLTPGFGEYRLQPQKTKYISEIKTVLFAPNWEKALHVTMGQPEVAGSDETVYRALPDDEQSRAADKEPI